MQRLLTIALLLCFGALAPLQGTSWRWCLLEHKLVSTGFEALGEPDGSEAHCCSHCERGTPTKHSDDCCVDMEQLPDSTLPASPERIPSIDCLLAVLPPMEWHGWLHPVVQEKLVAPSHPPKPIPIQAGQRQAVLSVWTV